MSGVPGLTVRERLTVASASANPGPQILPSDAKLAPVWFCLRAGFVYNASRQWVPARDAKVAELADALDLGSSGVTRESSSLSFRTTYHTRVNIVSDTCRFR